MKYTIEICKDMNSGLYTAMVNDVIIGDYNFEFAAKRACKKYIKNRCDKKITVFKQVIEAGDN